MFLLYGYLMAHETIIVARAEDFDAFVAKLDAPAQVSDRLAKLFAQAGPRENRSNFTVVCSCGKRISVATLRREVAEESAQRHTDEATFADELDAWLEALFAAEEDQEDDPRHEEFNLFGDPDFQMDRRNDIERGLS